MHRQYRIKLIEEQKNIEENYLNNIKGLEAVIEDIESKDSARQLIENNLRDESGKKLKSIENDRALASEEYRIRREALRNDLEAAYELKRAVSTISLEQNLPLRTMQASKRDTSAVIELS